MNTFEEMTKALAESICIAGALCRDTDGKHINFVIPPEIAMQMAKILQDGCGRGVMDHVTVALPCVVMVSTL